MKYSAEIEFDELERRKPQNAGIRAAVDVVKDDLVSNYTAAGVSGEVANELARQLLPQLIEFLFGLFKKKPKPVVEPKPEEEEEPTVPQPTFTSVPSSLVLKIKGVKRNGVHISGSDLKKIKDGSDPVNTEGDVVNLDLTPLDEHEEEISKGSKALEGLLVDPSYGTYLNVGDPMTYRYDYNGNPYATNKPWPTGFDNHRIHHIVSGPADQGGEYRNFGCGVNINPTEDGSISVYAECKRADGKVIKSNTISFRAKWWGS